MVQNQGQKPFFLTRVIQRIFYTGLVTVLPTLLVISVLVIAYGFLDVHIGSPINFLIKKQLVGSWRDFSIRYLKVDASLFEPLKIETYEELVARVQNSSLSFHQASQGLEEARKKFEDVATDRIQKKASTTDPDYIRFLDLEIQKLKQQTGLMEAEKFFKLERIKLRHEIQRENEIRLEKSKWDDNRQDQLKKTIEEKYPDVIGLFLAFFIILMIGGMIRTYAGNQIKKNWEKMLGSLPIIRKIFPYSKQLTEYLFKEQSKMQFQQVVLFEYPRKGVFAFGFLMGEDNMAPCFPEGLLSVSGKKFLSVFIPSSPTPFTGYVVLVDEKELFRVNMTIEETIRFVVTGGVVKPNLIERMSLENDDSLTMKEIKNE